MPFQKGNTIRKGLTPWNKGRTDLPSSWNKGKHHSPETIEKLKNRIVSKETRQKMCESGKKKIFTEEHRKNISIALTGEKGSNWNGGKCIHGDGYILIYKPDHPNSKKKYVLEHRLVMEQIIGRYLTKNEVVHHINEIPEDNRPENLILFTDAGKHAKHHKKLRQQLCV